MINILYILLSVLIGFIMGLLVANTILNKDE